MFFYYYFYALKAAALQPACSDTCGPIPPFGAPFGIFKRFELARRRWFYKCYCVRVWRLQKKTAPSVHILLNSTCTDGLQFFRLIDQYGRGDYHLGEKRASLCSPLPSQLSPPPSPLPATAAIVAVIIVNIAAVAAAITTTGQSCHFF